MPVKTLRDPTILKAWDDFLRTWPLERVRAMELPDFHQRQPDDFMSMLIRLKALGSMGGGGSEFKWGIFRRKDATPQQSRGPFMWDDEYGWYRKYGKERDEAFLTIRSRLVSVIDAVQREAIDEIDSIDLSPTQRWKVAFLYQDRQDPKLLAVYDEKRLRARYNEVFSDAGERPPSQLHTALIEHYSWLGDALDISPKIWLDPKDQPPPRPPGSPPPDAPAGRRYWLMSLGRRSSRWPACYEAGLASIGFDEHPVGDLREYSSLEDVGQAMEAVPGVDPRNTRLALWQFSNVMEPGDVIFVKRGQHDVVGHGAVRSQYRHVPTNERHKHVRDVQWESNLLPKGRLVGAEHQLPNKTLTDVTPYPDLVAALKAAVHNDPVPREKHPPNQILYGPPGTGKTYATVAHALAVIDGAEVREVAKSDKVRYRELRSEGRIGMVTFHQNYAYEDFVEGIRPKLAEPDDRNGAAETAENAVSSELAYELKPGIFRRICGAAERARWTAEDQGREPERFVLIIDEINRGNIPKIFGELITLIEGSRRLGADDSTTVALPYSGDEFGVPNNLYLIGTMNTADRSIQQLDTALRRRFTFVEMMPEPGHKLIPQDVGGVNCQEMLRAMNERIAVLLDREHQIGHTYLFKVKDLADLADRFRNRVFPLLQEYFYDDWRKIHAVLGGNDFVKPRKIGEGYAKGLVREFDLVDEETVTYERLPAGDKWEEAAQYRKIYGGGQSDPDAATSTAD